jgi:hypothetical protein
MTSIEELDIKTKDLKLDLNPSKKKIILEKFLEWSKNSSSHGYPHFFRTNRIPLKIMWMICFIIANGLCAYLILKSCSEYLEFSVNTQIRVINQIPMDFPSFQICNQNPFVSTIGRKFVLDYLRENLNENVSSYKTLREYATIEEENLYSKKSEYENLFEGVLIKAKNSNKSVQDSLGYTLDKLMLQCYFNYEKCDFTRDFKETYHHYYGMIIGKIHF